MIQFPYTSSLKRQIMINRGYMLIDRSHLEICNYKSNKLMASEIILNISNENIKYNEEYYPS